MEFLSYEDIRTIQIDPTSYCNLLCPQCARVHKGQLNSELPLRSLEPDMYGKTFNKGLVQQLDCVIFNGNYGDPFSSPHLEYAIDRLLGLDIKKVMLYTNGSLRTVDFWTKLGRKLKDTRHLVVFSVDGLKDTNPVYRVNSNFEKIMDNAKAFIDAGGRARWDFLVFEHNVHQLAEAKNLAENMGFISFNERKTSRFTRGETYEKKQAPSTQEIFDKKQALLGQLNEVKSESKKGARSFEEIVKEYGSWSDYINQTKIRCKYKEDMKAIFIDFNADVWPCTWLAAPKYFFDKDNKQRKDIENILSRYENGFNSLRSHELQSILKHPWFERDLAQSWTNTQDDANRKLMTCGRTCGESYEFSSGGRWKNSTIKRFNKKL